MLILNTVDDIIKAITETKLNPPNKLTSTKYNDNVTYECGYGEFHIKQYRDCLKIPENGQIPINDDTCMYKGMWKDDKPNGRGLVKSIILKGEEGEYRRIDYNEVVEWWEGEMVNGLRTGPFIMTKYY